MPSIPLGDCRNEERIKMHTVFILSLIEESVNKRKAMKSCGGTTPLSIHTSSRYTLLLESKIVPL